MLSLTRKYVMCEAKKKWCVKIRGSCIQITAVVLCKCTSYSLNL